MQPRRTEYLTEALVKVTGNAVVGVPVKVGAMDLVTVVVITWAREAVTVLVMAGAIARCGNRCAWKQVSDNLRGLMLPTGKSCD